MDLTSDSGTTRRCTSTAWEFYLSLAELYGWKRLGTLAPEGVPADEWDGTYSSNDGQRVEKEDATAIAEALERVFADPEREVRQRQVIREHGREDRELALRLYGIELPNEDDTEPLATDDDFTTLIAFLRLGSFRID